jgi:hypothetical protein
MIIGRYRFNPKIDFEVLLKGWENNFFRCDGLLFGIGLL